MPTSATLAATLSDRRSHFVAHLAPGGVLPLVFERTTVRFGAGPTTYEVDLVLVDPPFVASTVDGPTTSPPSATTRAPSPSRPTSGSWSCARRTRSAAVGSGPSPLPTPPRPHGGSAGARSKFNKKLDRLCLKLAEAGVPGLHGGPGDLASNRRARLVEHCLATRMVTAGDLPELDRMLPPGPET